MTGLHDNILSRKAMSALEVDVEEDMNYNVNKNFKYGRMILRAKITEGKKIALNDDEFEK